MNTNLSGREYLLSYFSVLFILLGIALGGGVPEKSLVFLLVPLFVVFFIPFALLFRKIPVFIVKIHKRKKNISIWIFLFLSIVFLAIYSAVFYLQVKTYNGGRVYFPLILDEETLSLINLAGGKYAAISEGPEIVRDELLRTTNAWSWVLTNSVFGILLLFLLASLFVLFYLLYLKISNSFYRGSSTSLPGDLKIQIQNLLRKNKIDEVFNLVHEKIIDPVFKEEISQIEKAYKNNEKKFVANEIDHITHSQSLAKIISATLNLLRWY